MIAIEICDCQLTPAEAKRLENAEKHQAIIQYAANALNQSICSGMKNNVTYLSLTGRKRIHKPEFIIGCQAQTVAPASTRTHSRVTKLVFTSSTYVGQAIQEVELGNGSKEYVRFDIRPHLGSHLDAYLLEHACGILLPSGMTAKTRGSYSRNSWLLALMWRCAFEKARRESFLPKEYLEVHSNNRFFKGRLDVYRHIRDNLTDASRIACSYRELSANTVINRTIRRIKHWFFEKNLMISSLADLEELDQRLAAMGVDDSLFNLEIIDDINYTRMTEPYRPLMKLSKLMLSESYGAKSHYAGETSPAYFVDYSEVWENYLLSIMRKELGGKYTFVSPNDLNEEENLLNCGRKVRPDFLVFDKNKKLIAVMDAKYKNISIIGQSGSVNYAVSREDLYQMITYLYHYGNDTTPLRGIFLTCGDMQGEKMQQVINKDKHFIGVCPLSLNGIDENDSCSDIDINRAMRVRSLDFCKRLDECLAYPIM